ncbi:hypothetical protein KUCAC02_018086, partial [Chaenocephalus aceratus]
SIRDKSHQRVFLAKRYRIGPSCGSVIIAAECADPRGLHRDNHAKSQRETLTRQMKLFTIGRRPMQLLDKLHDDVSVEMNTLRCGKTTNGPHAEVVSVFHPRLTTRHGAPSEPSRKHEESRGPINDIPHPPS